MKRTQKEIEFFFLYWAASSFSLAWKYKKKKRIKRRKLAQFKKLLFFPWFWKIFMCLLVMSLVGHWNILCFWHFKVLGLGRKFLGFFIQFSTRKYFSNFFIEAWGTLLNGRPPVEIDNNLSFAQMSCRKLLLFYQVKIEKFARNSSWLWILWRKQFELSDGIKC